MPDRIFHALKRSKTMFAQRINDRLIANGLQAMARREANRLWYSQTKGCLDKAQRRDDFIKFWMEPRWMARALTNTDWSGRPIVDDGFEARHGDGTLCMAPGWRNLSFEPQSKYNNEITKHAPEGLETYSQTARPDGRLDSSGNVMAVSKHALAKDQNYTNLGPNSRGRKSTHQRFGVDVGRQRARA